MVNTRMVNALSAAAIVFGTGLLVPSLADNAFAESVTVNNYESLNAELCKGGEIVLGADISVDAWLATDCDWIIRNNTTIDFNGHTITSAADRGYNIDFQDATLTFKDSVGGGGYTQLGANNTAIAITNGKFILESGTINATTWGVVLWHDSEFEMNGGSIIADNLAISGNGTTDPNNSRYGSNVKITINDGVIESKDDWAVYNPSENSTIDVHGGSITGGSGAIAANRGTISIDGGVFKSLGTADVEGDVSQDGTRGYENAVIGIPKEYGPVTVNISGGTFINENGAELIADVSGLDNENEATVNISGGAFSSEPVADEIIAGHEAELNEEEGVYEIWPINIDYVDGWLEDGGDAEGHVSTTVEFGSSLIADRKATLSAVEVDAGSLVLDESKGGELLGAVDINMLMRDGVTVIPVEDNQLAVYIDLDEEIHAMLSEYDKLFAVYFENGEEVERFEVTLSNPDDGYWLMFETTHLSTYGIVGVNGEEESSTATPETGTVTREGASAISAALLTAVAVGLLVAIITFTFLIRRI